MAHEQFEEVLPLYAVGALERAERQALEPHLLTGCASCHAALKQYRAVAGLLPYGLPLTNAPPTLKARVMAAVAHGSTPDNSQATLQSRPGPERSASRFFWPSLNWAPSPALALLLVLLLAGTGIYAMSVKWQIATEMEQRQRVETTLQEESARLALLQRRIAEQEQTLAGLRSQLDQKVGDLNEVRNTLTHREVELGQLRTVVAQQEQEATILRKALAQRDEISVFLRSPSVKVISLAGSAAAKSAGALLLYDPDSKKAFFYAFNMPPLVERKTYQLWAILDKPVSAGTFTTDPGHKSRLVIRNIPELARATKFAVSLEPEGGRPQPTGEIYLVGQL